MPTLTPSPPVITIDGPSGTGKGTVSKLIAKSLGWHYLDSGSIYRVLAYAAVKKNIDLKNEEALAILAQNLDLKFLEIDDIVRVILEQDDVTDAIRSESCGNNASIIAVFPKVRQALLEKQHAFRQLPGLVADGRDMGTVLFQDAAFKFFLTASTEERANRRLHQLKKAGVHASLATILRDLNQRDLRDEARGAAPLKPASDAIVIDTTTLSVNEVFTHIMHEVAPLHQT